METGDHAWLDKNFLQSVLQKEKNEKLNILRFTTKPALPPGNNYTSAIYRVQVVYHIGIALEEQSVSLIVKKPLEQGVFNELSELLNFFDKEPLMYEILLPKMYKKLNLEFGPKSLVSPIKNTVVMKDLKDEGYIMCKSPSQLDYSHCEKVFQIVAKFHASSVSCYHEDPEFVAQKVGVDKMWEDGNITQQWMANSIQAMKQVLKEVTVDEKFQSFFYSIKDHTWKSSQIVSKPKPEGLNVLNHGDLWVGNMLFKHDDSKNVVDIKLLDFQILRFASPVIDLIYFVWTSANEDVRKNKQKELYQIYLYTLNSTLEQLGCDERYRLGDLRKDLEACKLWALLVLCICFPIMMSPPEDALDMASFTEQDFASDKFRKLFDGKQFRTLLPNLTKHFTEFFLNAKGILQ